MDAPRNAPDPQQPQSLYKITIPIAEFYAMRGAIAPLDAIYRRWLEDGLDEDRPEWRRRLVNQGTKPLADVQLFSGRGGAALLTLADCLAAHVALGGTRDEAAAIFLGEEPVAPKDDLSARDAWLKQAVHAATCPLSRGASPFPCSCAVDALEALACGRCGAKGVGTDYCSCAEGPRKPAEPIKSWPFLESPGEFAQRLGRCLYVGNNVDDGGRLLAAVRSVLIENPPALADWTLDALTRSKEHVELETLRALHDWTKEKPETRSAMYRALLEEVETLRAKTKDLPAFTRDRANRNLTSDLHYLASADAHVDEGPLGEAAARSILEIALYWINRVPLSSKEPFGASSASRGDAQFYAASKALGFLRGVAEDIAVPPGRKAFAAELVAEIEKAFALAKPEPAIITEFVNPPIPTRFFDWKAVRDGYEPGDPIGWGETEEAANDALYDAEANRSGGYEEKV